MQDWHAESANEVFGCRDATLGRVAAPVGTAMQRAQQIRRNSGAMRGIQVCKFFQGRAENSLEVDPWPFAISARTAAAIPCCSKDDVSLTGIGYGIAPKWSAQLIQGA